MSGLIFYLKGKKILWGFILALLIAVPLIGQNITKVDFLLLAPGTAPSTATEGMLHYLDSANTLKFYDGAAWFTLLDTQAGVASGEINAEGGIDGYVLTADGAGNADFEVIPGVTAPTEPGLLENVGLATSVAANALTIDLTQADGSTQPDGGTYVSFRSETIADGDYNVRTISTDIDIVVPSGATLGCEAGSNCWIFVYLMDDAGTIELCVSTSYIPSHTITTATAIGTGSDATILYCDSASTGSIALIGRLQDNTAPNGTYAAVPDIITLNYNGQAKPESLGFIGFLANASTTTVSTSTPAVVCTSEAFDPYGSYTTSTFTAWLPGKYQINFMTRTGSADWSGGSLVEIYYSKSGGGGVIINRAFATLSTTQNAVDGSTIVYLDREDTIVLKQYSQVSVALDNAECSIYWVGP